MRKMSQRANRVILRIFRDTEAQISAGAPMGICVGPDFEKILGSKDRKTFEFFFIAQIDSKRLPTSSTSLFSPKFDQFCPQWGPV